MNIFLLDRNPTKAAAQYHNKHVVKMVLETAQLLCSAHEPGMAPYKRTHYYHPCAQWTRTSLQNYFWLVDLGKAIAAEYTKRYGKRHKSEDVIDWCEENIPLTIPDGVLTEFPQCMPDAFKKDDSVEAYRAYYVSKLEKFK